MNWWRPSVSRFVLAVMVLAPSLLTILFSAAAVDAQGPTPLPWEQLGVQEPVTRVFTPPSGVIFAQTKEGLVRSADGGTSWDAIPLPEPSNKGPRKIAVHPTEPHVVYAQSNEGLSKTTNGGAAWVAVNGPFGKNPDILALAVSSADSDLVFATLAGVGYRLVRTQDGGENWDVLHQPQSDLCSWSTTVLSPHPTDPDRLHVSSNCLAGRSTNAILEMRSDRGAQVDSTYRTAMGRLPVAWSGGLPAGRFLMVLGDLGNGYSANTSVVSVQRSDSDGKSWIEVLHLESIGGGEGWGGLVQPNRFDVAAVVQDPKTTDHAYIAFNQRLQGIPLSASRIMRYTFLHYGPEMRSTSPGASVWADIGIMDLGTVDDLGLSADGQYLYAATENGLWRLPQPASQPLR